jgi:hypothetical protein
MTITQQDVDTLRQEFMTQAINHRLISNAVARSSINVEYCHECFNIALQNIGKDNLSHINMPAGVKRDGVRVASTFIHGYLTAKSMEVPTDG